MISKRDQVLLGIGILAVIGAALLPVPQHTVQSIAEESLVREQAKDVFNAAELTHNTSVSLIYRLDSDSGVVSNPEELTALIVALQHTDDEKVTDAAFKVSEQAPHTLCVSVKKSDGYINATTTLSEIPDNCDATDRSSKAHQASGTQRIGDGFSLVPPLIALVIAIALRKVVWALFLAVFSGGIIMNGNPFINLWLELKTLILAIPSMFGLEVELGGYIGTVIADSFNLQILGFTLALVGMVAVISRMGGTAGLVNSMSRFARGPRSAQAVTSAMGTAVFFDDYANTVVVGTTARTLTDRHRISREKLAYIVDSTSAPVAGIAIVSTWIGYEVGLFDSLLGMLSSVENVPSSGYELFFEILPLRFYCIFALLLVFLNAWTARDFGPMYEAEMRTRGGGPVVPEGHSTDNSGLGQLAREDIPHRALNAIIPIASVLLGILGSILWIGAQAGPLQLGTLMGWKDLFDLAADHIQTILFGAALLGSLIAIVLSLSQRLLGLREAMSAYASGVKTLWEAVAILILAWAIKNVCGDVGTGHTLIALVGDSIPSAILPLVIFILSGVVAFSTGSSWATMALVLPIAAPLSADLSGGSYLIVMASLGAVLDGAIWGDHCSPISDTTILSSTATGCPHLAHVKTQLPYATLAMVAAALVGYLGVTAGIPIGVAYLVGPLVMLAGLYLFGRPVPHKVSG